VKKLKKIVTSVLITGILASLLLVGVAGAAQVCSIATATPIPTVTSCDSEGNERNSFVAGEIVYIKGENFTVDATNYRLWIQDPVLGEGDILDVGEDPSEVQEYLYVDGGGRLEKDGTNIIGIWQIPEYAIPTYRNFTIVVDELGNGNEGRYNSTYDVSDGSISAAGFIASVPDLSTSLLLSVGLLGLVGYVGLKRRKD